MPPVESHVDRPNQPVEQHESLMTQKALELSLAPPRCPPFGTAHRSVLLGVRPLDDPYVEHDHDGAHSNYNFHSGIQEGLEHLVFNARLPGRHPHLMLGPAGADQITRFLGSLLPLKWQNHVRDTGGFRSIFDTIVESSIPVGAVANPCAALRFLRLTRQCQVIRYGDHGYQYIELYLPDEDRCPRDQWSGMVFFVHGGAWGSGHPWYYRLVAQTYLDLDVAVAIIGYRVYPDGDTKSQVADLEMAYLELSRRFPDLCGPKRTKRKIGFSVQGHSSGAHISMLWLVEQAKRNLLVEQLQVEGNEIKLFESDATERLACDTFVGISGIYNIGHHFDYEAARGVEELSPMKACNGHTREQFLLNSPPPRLQNFLATFSECVSSALSMDRFFPRMLLVHGIEDDTVPFTSTSEGARIMRMCGVQQCEEFYAPLTGHQDAVIHLMLGGRVKDYIQHWLSNLHEGSALRSKL